jgi:hypothetical protein
VLSVAVSVTVTSPLFHPAAFGADERLAVLFGAVVSAATTVSMSVADWAAPPLAPVTVRVYDPGVTLGPTATVKVLLAEPLAGGVTELGEKLPVTPAGWPEQLSVVALLKLPSDCTVAVLVPLWPWVTLNVEGLQLTLKSVTVTGISRLWVWPPLVPVTVTT